MNENSLSLVGRPAPDFEAPAVMPDGTFKTLSLNDFRGAPLVFFFYPLDFTFVCPTEIVAFSDAAAEFERLGANLLACSVDSVYAHFAWTATPRSEGGIGRVRFPLLSDLTKQIAADYDVLVPEKGIALRGLFVIDKSGVVQSAVVNNAPFGRSVHEALRAVQALEFYEKNGEVCPADWREGERGLKENPADAKEYFRQKYGDGEYAEPEKSAKRPKSAK